MSQQVEYHEGKIGAFIQVVVGIIKKNPQAIDDIKYLKAILMQTFPELRDRSICPNCEASMKEYVYTLDAWDALLLLEMAKAVREKRRKGIDFTIANQTRVPELGTSHAVKCRTTQSAKLGLITQLKTKDGKRVSGVWVVTRRGWDALKGQSVPKKVKVWRKKIEERFDETVTIQEALGTHSKYVEETIKKGRNPKEDHRESVREYTAQEWYDFEVHEGQLF